MFDIDIEDADATSLRDLGINGTSQPNLGSPLQELSLGVDLSLDQSAVASYYLSLAS